MHLNRGLAYKRPMESPYSIVRRFLIGNPGVDAKTYRTELATYAKDQKTNRASLFDLLMNGEKLSPLVRGFPQEKHITKHCPECAKAAYHTDIFRAEWISTCPLHRIELINECPGCKQPWPTIYELATRDCKLCATSKLEEEPASTEHYLDREDYWRLARLYKFLNAPKNYQGMLLGQETVGASCTNVSVCHADYPSLRYYNSAYKWRDELDQFNVSIKPTVEVNTYLSPLDNLHSLADYEIKWQYKRLIQCRIEALNTILEFAHTHGHQIRISNFRHLCLKVLVRSPPPCPFCWAASRLLFFIANDPFVTGRTLNKIPERILEELGLDQIPPLAPFTQFIDAKRNCYLMSQDFLKWTYKHKLIHMFGFSLEFFTEISNWFYQPGNNIKNSFELYTSLTRSTYEDPFLFIKRDHQLSVRCLDYSLYKISNQENLKCMKERCDAFRDHCKDEHNIFYFFDEPLPRLISESQYLLLNAKLIDYLRGSSKIGERTHLYHDGLIRPAEIFT
jgi:hypothetical protein